jgi:multidrug efflux pump
MPRICRTLIEGMPEIRRVDIVSGHSNAKFRLMSTYHECSRQVWHSRDIQQAIQSENINVSGGDLNVDGVRRTVRVKGEFTDVDRSFRIFRYVPQLVQQFGLTILPRYAITLKNSRILPVLNNKSVVTLNVIKRAGANLISAADNIEKTIEEYKETRFPQGLRGQGHCRFNRNVHAITSMT